MIITGGISGVYSCCFLGALIINAILIACFLRKKHRIGEILGFLFYENFGFIMGAKVFSYFINYPQYKSILSAGVSAYGALFGGLLMTFIFCKMFNFSFNYFFCQYITLLPLMYSIGKLGCFFGGCCYGVEYNSLLSVMYLNSKEAPSGVFLFPVQLLESIINLSVFVWTSYSKNTWHQKVSKVIILCASSKFIFDFFRASWAGYISANQWISIIIILGVIVINKYAKWKQS